MTQFLADITGILELFAIAAGLVLLHKASKERPAKLLTAAGLVLAIGGVAVGVCTSWYWLEYQAAGEFEHATPWHAKMGPHSHTAPRMHWRHTEEP